MNVVTLAVPCDLTQGNSRAFMRNALEVAIEARADVVVFDLGSWEPPVWFVECCEKMVEVLAEMDCRLQVDGIELADLPIVVASR